MPSPPIPSASFMKSASVGRRFRNNSVSSAPRLRIAPGDELRDDEAGIAPLAEAEFASLAVGHPAAGRGHDRATGPDVPFRGRPEAGIDVRAAFCDPPEFHGRADRPSD